MAFFAEDGVLNLVTELGVICSQAYLRLLYKFRPYLIGYTSHTIVRDELKIDGNLLINFL